MTRRREFADAVPSMPESEARTSLEDWRRLESRRQWWWIAVASAVAAAVLVSFLLWRSGGVIV